LGSAINKILAKERPFLDLEEEEIEAQYTGEKFPSPNIITVGGTAITSYEREAYRTADEVVTSLDAVLAVL